jgi:hypothetical protein
MVTGASMVSADSAALVLVHRQPGCKVWCINITYSGCTVGVVCFTRWEVPTKKKTLARPRCGWEDNIKIDLKVIGWSGMNWIHVAHNRDLWWGLVNMVMNLWVL